MDQGFQTTSRAQSDSNRRRFSDEQIKYMEYMFETQSRPESQIKEQLANELGLQPRQVSIWFQNRRARLKSKQIEREYNELKENYDALASSFESLQRENQILLTKLQKMKQAMQRENENGVSDQNQSSNGQKSESRDTNLECKEQNERSLGDYSNKEDMFSSNEDSKKNEEETEMFNMTQYRECSIMSSEWNSIESNRFLNKYDESSCSSKWWEFFP
ncbi:Homeobox-leucine zipper protein family [Euphorbia peplus]|nr:Homeobox-leucine zipper protein family [Euphorbia peplus]